MRNLVLFSIVAVAITPLVAFAATTAGVPIPHPPWHRLALFASVLATGIVAGLFVGTQLGQVRVQDALGARDFTLFKHEFERAVGSIMPPLLIVTTLSPVPFLLLSRAPHEPSFILTAVALALWIAATIVTLVINVPINSQAAKWDPAQPPADWQQLRARWNLGQTIRTALVVPGFAALVAAALVGR